MSKVGRNELCPCGSGKKYKKCCESKDVDAAAERTRANDAAAAQRLAENRLPPSVTPPRWVPVELPIDQLSNSVVRLVKEKRLDEALAACERLRVEFPEAPDWLERSAMVHEALGNTALAVDFYKKSLAFTELPEQRDGFDEEMRDFYRGKISALEAALAATSPT
jgi:tetratricopeptide (TPR) repeat protein